MKIGVAQIQPIPGDIHGNIARHKRIIESAVANKTDVIIFPELSLTGYEPTLAYSLAMKVNDSRLNDFQQISDRHAMTIGVGVPTQHEAGICISMIIFQPHQERRVYSKKYLHPDEEEFFVRGDNFPIVTIHNLKLAFAICYELSVPEHADYAFKNGAEVYVASVAKSERGIEPATKRLQDIAMKHTVPVLLSNSIGEADGEVCIGKTAAWNSQGELLAQLNDKQEGIIVMDSAKQTVIESLI